VKQILIADDDAVSRRVLANELEGWDYDVVSASDGAEAWEMLQQDGAPQLAILDWMMPGMTGPDVCAAVRKRDKEPYTYILLLTGRTEKRDLVEGMAAGADDYITKPFDKQELKVRVNAGQRILDLQAQLVNAREALREQATHDPLTRLWNRHAILDILDRELNRAGRDGSPLGLLIADLDHFKRINDTCGHLAGDAVLREVARRMQASVRKYDAVGRYGGEEFLIILPGSNEAHALHLAERIREQIGSEPVASPEGTHPITASVGVTGWAAGAVPPPELLIRAADSALYRAKSTGRNRVEWGVPERDAALAH
jgi:two-component system cell cycle response regulator